MPSKLDVAELLKVAAEVKGDPRRFTSYKNRPVAFCKEILGLNLWKKQADLLVAVANGRRVSCRSGHGVGKTTAAAASMLWWLYARQGRVFSTAPTKEHVEDALWFEVNKLWRKAIVPLPGHCYTTSLIIEPDWYATGITTDQAGAFQGRHHPNLYVVIDEAAGVGEPIHEEISTCASGENNCVLMIGNPTTTSGTFYESHNKLGIWKKLHISCLEHPNLVQGREVIAGAVSRHWVEEKREEWGENHPLWFSRVLGEFPRISTRGVIPLMWVERAQDENARRDALEQAKKERLPRIGGLDVARYGDNVCVLIVRHGDAIEHIEAWSHLSLMETTGKAIKAIQDFELSMLIVDASGIGAGVVDRMQEQGVQEVVPFNGGSRAFNPSTFANKRSELWWSLRQRFEKSRLWLPPNCAKLVADLIAPEYKLKSTGRIHIDTKEEMLDKGKKSPDFADALCQCFALDEDPIDLPAEKPAFGQDPTPYVEVVDYHQFEQFPVGY